MATKIRLQRHGRKGYAFYHIVIADSRAPRDGKFIERIGSYNPNTNPATIDLNFERALYWLQTGAQPTDTTRNVLSSQGVLMMKHLLGGVKKGAFSEAEAQTKFQNWIDKKNATDNSVSSKNSEAEKVAEKARLEAEKEVNKAKATALAAKKAEKAAALAAAQVRPAEEAAPIAEAAPVEEAASIAEAAPAEEAASAEKTVAE